MKENGHLTAISGGIGAGKSVVSRILRAMGFDVYDCDSEARKIIDRNSALKQSIDREVAPGCLNTDGSIDRRVVADVVFADKAKLEKLNSLVHGAVLDDLDSWRREHSGKGKRMFVETAILYQSGLDKRVDEVWEVMAPDEIRVERVMARNNLTDSEVRERIAAQAYTPSQPHTCVHTIDNSGAEALLPRLMSLLEP